MIYQHIPDKLKEHLDKIEQELIARYSSQGAIANALLLGEPNQMHLLQASQAKYRHLACENYPGAYSQTTPLPTQIYFSHFTDLPFAPESMDFIILPHVLEFSTEPAQILKEASECLSSRGALLIFSLSPFSHFVPLLNSNNKIHFSPLSAQTIKHLLSPLDMKITVSQSFFSPLSYHFPHKKWLQFIEKTVMPYLPFLCHAYYIVAQKNVMPVERISAKTFATLAPALTLQEGCAARSGNS